MWPIALVLLSLATPARAQLQAVLVVSGLSRPVAVVQDPTNAGVQFVVEQGGRIRVVQNGSLLAQDFLNLTTAVTSDGERGLLGLAFAPDYVTSGRFFVDFTNLSGNTVIARFRRSAANPLVADASTRFDLVWPGGNAFITQPFANHNGGQVAFGSDNLLYIGMGDGGSGNDPGNRAQDLTSLLGKILRVDVSVGDTDPRGYHVPADNPFVGVAGALGEIWDLGVRNPWRFSFDSMARGGTGALVIGDVGEGQWEEVDYEPAGAGGRNYGWRNREGAHDNITTVAPVVTPLVDPTLEYAHDVGRSITGGFVYRGIALGPSFVGRYFFGDFVFGRVWSVGLTVNGTTGEATAGAVTEHTSELGAAASQPSAFGIDANGELLLLNYSSGSLYRIGTAAANSCTTPDPFVALGGGTCFDGGWYPPGYPIPTAPPPPPPPPPPPAATGCTTPDPFVALGGGTCLAGGWYPPGYPIPTAAPPPPPTSPPSSPPPSTGCATPDPFVALGGGTCFAGGWYPPGYPIPSATPPSPPPPPPTSTGCTTPDPFVALGGGTCFQGGWYPPGYPIPGGGGGRP